MGNLKKRFSDFFSLSPKTQDLTGDGLPSEKRRREEKRGIKRAASYSVLNSTVQSQSQRSQRRQTASTGAVPILRRFGFASSQNLNSNSNAHSLPRHARRPTLTPDNTPPSTSSNRYFPSPSDSGSEVTTPISEESGYGEDMGLGRRYEMPKPPSMPVSTSTRGKEKEKWKVKRKPVKDILVASPSASVVPPRYVVTQEEDGEREGHSYGRVHAQDRSPPTDLSPNSNMHLMMPPPSPAPSGCTTPSPTLINKFPTPLLTRPPSKALLQPQPIRQSRLTSLPTPLLDTLFSHFGTRDLLSLALVNTTLRSLAQKRLWSDVCIPANEWQRRDLFVAVTSADHDGRLVGNIDSLSLDFGSPRLNVPPSPRSTNSSISETFHTLDSLSLLISPLLSSPHCVNVTYLTLTGPNVAAHACAILGMGTGEARKLKGLCASFDASDALFMGRWFRSESASALEEVELREMDCVLSQSSLPREECLGKLRSITAPPRLVASILGLSTSETIEHLHFTPSKLESWDEVMPALNSSLRARGVRMLQVTLDAHKHNHGEMRGVLESVGRVRSFGGVRVFCLEVLNCDPGVPEREISKSLSSLSSLRVFQLLLPTPTPSSTHTRTPPPSPSIQFPSTSAVRKWIEACPSPYLLSVELPGVMRFVVRRTKRWGVSDGEDGGGGGFSVRREVC